MKDSKLKNRYFQAVLYPDDDNCNEYLNNIQNKFKEVTWITHDKDIADEDGNLAKAHIHVLFKVGENARGINSVAKDIGIEPNYIGGTKKIPFLRYLIHLDNPEKTQYPICAVHGQLKEELEKILSNNIEEDKQLADMATEIFNHKINSSKELMLYAINNHCAYTMKKYSYILINMIGENKDEYKKLREEKERKQTARKKFIRNIKNRTK